MITSLTFVIFHIANPCLGANEPRAIGLHFFLFFFFHNLCSWFHGIFSTSASVAFYNANESSCQVIRYSFCFSLFFLFSFLIFSLFFVKLHTPRITVIYFVYFSLGFIGLRVFLQFNATILCQANATPPSWRQKLTQMQLFKKQLYVIISWTGFTSLKASNQ